MDTITIKLSRSLYEEMEGGGYAQGDEGEEARAVFGKLASGKALDREEARLALDAVESQQLGMEAVAGGASLDFEEAGRLAAARRSAESVARRLRAFLD